MRMAREMSLWLATGPIGDGRFLDRRRPRPCRLACIIVATAGLALVSPECGWSQGLICPVPDEPEVLANVEMPSSTIRSERTVAALTKDSVVQSERHQRVGVYIAALNVGLSVRFGLRQTSRELCLWVTGAVANITLQTRDIFIGNEFLRGSCEYRAILDHELRHARTDDAVIRAHLPRIQETLRQAIIQAGVIGPVPQDEQIAARRSLETAVANGLRAAVARLNEDRKARQAKVDTPEEYQRVAEICPSGLRIDRLSD